MKIRELLEMHPPYWAKGEKPPRHWHHILVSKISLNALEREYDDLNVDFKIEALDVIIHFYRNKDSKSIIGGFREFDNEEQIEKFSIVFTLNFKAKTTLKNYPSDIKRNKLLQVNKVVTIKDYANYGLASYVYISLVKAGFTILSDITQLDGGKGLWEKMARRANLSDYRIRILDDERGYLKDNSGKVIEYDGHKNHEEDIWTSGLDFDGEHKLLVISSL